MCFVALRFQKHIKLAPAKFYYGTVANRILVSGCFAGCNSYFPTLLRVPMMSNCLVSPDWYSLPLHRSKMHIDLVPCFVQTPQVKVGKENSTVMLHGKVIA